MTKALSDLIRIPEQRGWRVTGFYQLSNGRWRCALTGPEARCIGGIEYEEGDTPEAAVEAAIQCMNIARERGTLTLEQTLAYRMFQLAVARLAKALT